MCGIFGMVSARTGLQEELLEKATDSIAHRGPDDSGYHREPNALLGFRRLSIIDLSGGHQPIYNEDRSKCIIFNGEIYNFLGLREELLKRGHLFSTRSDTETILHAYEEWGEGCLERLRGMFAFAIWDSRQKSLFAARDRFGIKPLFYAEHAGRLYFASEMKAILADSRFPREMDEDALASYFTLSYIPAPLSIFKHIRKLPPGHALFWQDGRLRLKEYWDIRFSPEEGRSERYFIDGFLGLLEEAVKMHLISEVPLGAFLSGGIDSSSIVAMMTRALTTPVNTFSIGFGGNTGGYLDERGYAQMVARRYHTRHFEHEVLPQPQGLIETIVRAFDEPIADDSTIPSYYVCKIAREQVTVALSGLGGDEAMGGYERYLGFMARGAYRKVPGFIRTHVLEALINSLPERSDGHYTINHMKRFARSASFGPDEGYLGFLSRIGSAGGESLFADPDRFRKHTEACRGIMLGHFNSDRVEGGPDNLNRAFYCDVKTYLPEDILAVTDRLSMHHSLEARVPFLDHKLFEFCARIPPSLKMKWFQKKYLFKKAIEPLVPRPILTHRKQGFVGPMAQWLKTDLKPFVAETLCRENLKRHGLLNHGKVQQIIAEHMSGREIHDTLIWSMLIFQKWFDLYIEKKEY